MAEAGSRNNDSNNNQKDNANTATNTKDEILERNLQRMESLLRQSALGVHILFDNKAIAKVMSDKKDDRDFFDFDKMKKVQDSMTELIAKKTYFDKMDYLQKLDSESYEMLIRTYFHIVENTVRANNSHSH